MRVGFEMPYALLKEFGHLSDFTHVLYRWYCTEPAYRDWVLNESPAFRILDNSVFECGMAEQPELIEMITAAREMNARVVQLPELTGRVANGDLHRILSENDDLQFMGIPQGYTPTEFMMQVHDYAYPLGCRMIGLPYYSPGLSKQIEDWRLSILINATLAEAEHDRRVKQNSLTSSHVRPHFHMLGFGGNLGILKEEVKYASSIDTSWPIALALEGIQARYVGFRTIKRSLPVRWQGDISVPLADPLQETDDYGSGPTGGLSIRELIEDNVTFFKEFCGSPEDFFDDGKEIKENTDEI